MSRRVESSFPVLLFVVLAVTGCAQLFNPDTGGGAKAQITLSNRSTYNLTLSCYDWSSTSSSSSALATAAKTPSGKTDAVNGFPTGRDLQFKLANDLAAPTNYILVDTVGPTSPPHAFRLSPLRRYDLELTGGGSTTLGWDWNLAANPAWEVSSVIVTPGVQCLSLSWVDPSVADLEGISVRDSSGTVLATIARGVERATISGLGAGLPVALTLVASYPEIDSRGVESSGTPGASPAPAPIVQSTVPAVDATGVATNGTIKAVFDRYMLASSFTSSTFYVSDSSGAKVPAGVSVNGYTATVTPLTPLAYSSAYTVTIKSTVLTTAGGALGSDCTWGFVTGAAPLLGPAQFLATAMCVMDEALTTGDVNGDGWTDLVMVTGSYNDPAHDRKLVIFVQNPQTHALDAPLFLDTQVGVAADPSGVAIGNLTGHTDGLKDIIVAVEGKGIVVFKQNTDHSFGPGLLYAQTNVYTLQVGDFNHDGRTDIATVAWSSTQASLWLQQANGTLSPMTTIGINVAGYDDLAAGDIDGDGKDDLVAMSGQLYACPISASSRRRAAPSRRRELGGSRPRIGSPKAWLSAMSPGTGASISSSPREATPTAL